MRHTCAFNSMLKINNMYLNTFYHNIMCLFKNNQACSIKINRNSIIKKSEVLKLRTSYFPYNFHPSIFFKVFVGFGHTRGNFYSKILASSTEQ